MPFAAITAGFNPAFSIAGLSLRWETLGSAAAILVALVIAALLAERFRAPAPPARPKPARDQSNGLPEPRSSRGLPEPGGLPEPRGGSRSQATPMESGSRAPSERLAARASRQGPPRLDDLLFIALGAIPGAIAGGRLIYVLTHFDFYSANPGAIVDATRGSIALSGMIVGGALTAGLIAQLLDGRVRRWLAIAPIPVLAGIVAGKLAMLAGGAGMGSFSDLPWAIAYTGDGAWGSRNPAIPAHPSQLYEALAIAAALGVVAFLWRRWPVGDLRPAWIALGLIGVVRFAVGFSWTDAGVLGPIRAEQLVSLGLIALGAAAFALDARRGSPAASDEDGTETAGVV